MQARFWSFKKRDMAFQMGDSGNTSVPMTTLCSPVALGERERLLHPFPKEIKPSEGK